MIGQAVILAGGRGTRLMPLTANIPKPLIPVNGQPFLFWQLRYLKDQGISRVLLLVSHLGEMIRAHFSSQPIEGLQIQFAFESEPLGTGGALKAALPLLEDRFWLVNGDSFLPIDLKEMEKFASLQPVPAIMAVLTNLSEVPVPGNIQLSGEIVSAYRKNAGIELGFSCVDAGLYQISKKLISSVPAGKFDLEAYWPKLIQSGSLRAHRIIQPFFDIGTPERLRKFEERIHDYF